MGDKLRSQSCSFDLFIASRTPSIEKFKAYSLAKAHNFLREMMKKILWEVYTSLRRFRIFVIDSKIHQALHFYLKSTKTNRPAKVTRVLSGKFIESSTTLLNRQGFTNAVQNTHSKLVLTKVNFGSKFV